MLYLSNFKLMDWLFLSLLLLLFQIYIYFFNFNNFSVYFKQKYTIFMHKRYHNVNVICYFPSVSVEGCFTMLEDCSYIRMLTSFSAPCTVLRVQNGFT